MTTGERLLEHQGKIRVVVVEDNLPLRELTKEVLNRAGVFDIVGEAHDGNGAVRECERTLPDLLLLDLRLPNRDGFSALPDIRRISPATKVVAYSMLPRDSTEPKARALGAVDFIEKSIESDDLIVRLLDLFRICEVDTPSSSSAS